MHLGSAEASPSGAASAHISKKTSERPDRRHPDRLIQRLLSEGGEQLHDQVYDAVRAQIE